MVLRDTINILAHHVLHIWGAKLHQRRLFQITGSVSLCSAPSWLTCPPISLPRNELLQVVCSLRVQIFPGDSKYSRQGSPAVVPAMVTSTAYSSMDTFSKSSLLANERSHHRCVGLVRHLLHRLRADQNSRQFCLEPTKWSHGTIASR